MSNTGMWVEEYYDGSPLYPDQRTVLVHKLVKPTLAQSFNLSTEAWHTIWKGYLDPTKAYVLFKKDDLNQLGYSCPDDPNTDLFLPLKFLVDLNGKQYKWNTGYKPKDSNNNDLYGIVGRNHQGKLMPASSTQALDSVSNSPKLTDIIDKRMCHWHTVKNENSFRSVNPKTGLTLLINPTGAQNGITNGQIVNAFERVISQTTCHTTYIFEPEAGKTFADYTLLSTSPFYLYETWIRTDEFLSQIEEDRPFPKGFVEPELTKWANKVYKTASKTPSDPVAQFKLTYDQFLAGVKQGAGTPTAINAGNIERAVGKRKEVKTQKSTMGGLSASDLTVDFGWHAAAPKGLSKAEWLHLIAFSFGGIGAGNSYHDSQLSLNFIFGTAECNSVMYRYEGIWQALYKYEAELRGLSQKAGPEGVVQAQVNDGLVVKPLHLLSGPRWTFGNNPQGLHETLAQSFPWLCYALRYRITIDDSLIFRKPTTFAQEVEFFPFTRPFFTKVESLVDRFLLDELYNKRKTAIKEEIANANANANINAHANTATNFNTSSLQASSWAAVPSVFANEVADDFQWTRDGSSKREDNSILSSQGHETILIPDRTEEPQPKLPDDTVSSIRSLESQLVALDNFSRLESPDLLLDIAERVIQPNADTNENVYSITNDSQFDAMVVNMPQHADAEVSYSYTVTVPEETATEPVMVGGIQVDNVTLIMVTNEETVKELPVTVAPINVGNTEEGLLLVPTNTQELTKPPILLMPSTDAPEVDMNRITGLATISEVQDLAHQSFDSIGTLRLGAYSYTADIKQLFGVPNLSGKLSVFQATGSQPLLEEVIPSLDDGVGGVFGTLFPQVQNDVMKYIPLKRTSFKYSEDDKDIINHPGLRFEADLAFEGVLQPVADSLKYLAGQSNEPPKGLRIAAHLSNTRNWGNHLPLCNVVLQGSLTDMSWKLWDVLDFKTVGVEVSTTKVATIGKDQPWSFGYGFFGVVHINQVFGPAPLELKYRISKHREQYSLGMSFKSGDWKNACGIENLTLSEVIFQASFSSRSIEKSFRCQVSARAQLGDILLDVTGSFSKDNYTLSAHVGNLSWSDISKIFLQLTGQDISQDTQGNDLCFEDMSLTISNTGFAFHGKISFNGYSSAEGYFVINTDGIAVGGSIAQFTIDGSQITIKEASLDIFLAANSSRNQIGRASKFAIQGVFDFEESRVAVGLQLSKSKSSKLGWILYGALDNARLSRFIPSMEGDFDICFKKAAILASNQDQTVETGSAIGGFPVSKGIQICAVIEPLPAVKALETGQAVGDLMLIASYDASNRLGITIKLPESFGIEGTRVSMKNFGLGLEISSTPKILLNADFFVKMEKQEALVLATRLAGSMLDAEGSFKTKNAWNNPFNASPDVVIESIAGQMGITYATVAVSGPSKFALAGKVRAGAMTFGGALSIGQKPDEQLLYIDLDNVHLGRLIHFAGEIANSKILKELQCEGDLVFNKAMMYFSTGARIHNITYEPGISANGNMTLFGKQASFSASIGATGLELYAAVDNFKVGPLEVSSASGGDQARFDFAMTTTNQIIKVDGLVGLYDLNLKTLIHVSLQPAVFDIDIFIGFTDQLTFVLNSKAENIKSLKDLSEGDLSFFLDINADIIGVLTDAIISVIDDIRKGGFQQFDNLNRILESELNDSRKQLDEAQEKLRQEDVQVSQRNQELHGNIETWQLRYNEAKAKLEQLEADVANKTTERQQQIDAAEAEYKQAKQKLEELKTQKQAEYQREKEKTQQELDNLWQEQQRQTELSRKICGPIEAAVQNKQNILDATRRYFEQVKRDAEEADANFKNANYLAKPYYLIKRDSANALLLTQKAALWTEENGLETLRKGFETEEYRSIKDMLDGLNHKISEVSAKLQNLENIDYEQLFKIVIQDGEAKVRGAKERRDAAIQGALKLQQTIDIAIETLERERENLLATIAEMDEKINQAKHDKILAQLKANASAAKKEHAAMEERVQQLTAALAVAQSGFDTGTSAVSDAMKFVKHNTFRLTRVTVKASTRDMKENKPLVFELTATVAGNTIQRSLGWCPGQTPADWYKSAASALMK